MPNPQSLFQNPEFKLDVGMAGELVEPVGTQAFSLPEQAVATDGASLQIFDRALPVSGSAAATAEILAADDSVADLFGDGVAYRPADGESLARLKAAGHFGIRGSDAGATIPGDPLSLTARGSVDGGLTLTTVIAVAESNQRLDAFRRLAKATRLPGQIHPAGWPRGAVQSLGATFDLELGIQGQYGTEFRAALSKTVFEGLPVALKVQGEITAKASLGLHLHEAMSLTVGSGPGLTVYPDWVRVRIARRHQRQITFGAMISLQAEYDLGSSLIAILDQALADLPPLPRLAQSFIEIDRLIASGDWDTVKSQLSGRAADALSEWLDGTGWQQWAAGSPKVKALLKDINEVVDAYQDLGPRLQSWWNQLLGAVDLAPGSPVRQALQQLAGLDADQLPLDELLTGDAAKVAHLVEVFTGKSLEDLLLPPDSDGRELLRDAVADARKADDFLNSVPKNVLGKIQDFADRTGAAGTIRFLASNATSLDQAEAWVSERVESFASRLVDKAFGRLTATDLKKIQGWAQRVEKLLDEPRELEAKLRAALSKLKGDLGFTLSLEFDRLVDRQALIDLEVDPENKFERLHGGVQKGLTRGSIRTILQTLEAEGSEKEYQESPLPFLLRECAFESRKVHTTTASTLLHLTGLDKVFQSLQRSISRRVEETSVRVIQRAGDDGPVFSRQATYAAGFERTEIRNLVTNRSAVWLESRESGSGADISRAYDGQDHTHALRLSFWREDQETHPNATRSLTSVLSELGFVFAGSAAGDAPAATAPPPAARTRFGLSAQFPGEAARAFGQHLKPSEWNPSFLSAARRWFDDGTVAVPFPAIAGANLGQVLEAITRSPAFEEEWAVGSREFAAAVSGGMRVRVEGIEKLIQVVRPTGGGSLQYRSPYLPLKRLIDARRPSIKHQKRIAKALDAVTGSRSPDDYRKLSRTFALGWNVTAAASASWPSSAFPLWLVLAHLTAVAPETLEQATGIAFLRWRTADQDDWSPPAAWKLENGLRPFQVIT
ncbi:MAG: hypothetical protein AAF481_06100 [Acidobacteriota bacterium]